MERSPLFLVFALASACGPQVSSGPPTDYEPEPAGGEAPAFTLSELALPEGVTAMDVSCAEGAGEACNALDDDCNGVIDDSCGYAGGAVQVTVAWNGDVDLNLALGGDRAATATTDHAGKGACEEGEREGRIENAYWAGAVPAQGHYEVALEWADDCGTGLETATATVSVTVGGKVVGVLNTTLEAGAKKAVVSFEVS